MTSCSASNITVQVDRKTILNDVSLTVAPREWITIVGPNGAGKSTLLSVLAGLRTSDGQVCLDGREVSSMSPRERALLAAYVPQHPAVPAGMSVQNYVLIGRTPHLSVLGVEGRDDYEVVDRVMHQLDLSHLAHRTLDSLSGGELQRCHLARAIAQQTSVVFFDEPTTALDLGHQQQVLELINGLQESQELTVVMTMHDLSLASQYSDRVFLLGEGKIAAHGRPQDVLDSERLSSLYGARIAVLEVDGHIVVIPGKE
ncbi:MAG: ABC transporter ATP-binding protein [Acidimicrobiales bacterium]|nr:ABC transporter ATP-binding protein [Acidimicrobiales bacterium]